MAACLEHDRAAWVLRGVHVLGLTLAALSRHCNDTKLLRCCPAFVALTAAVARDRVANVLLAYKVCVVVGAWRREGGVSHTPASNCHSRVWLQHTACMDVDFTPKHLLLFKQPSQPD